MVLYSKPAILHFKPKISNRGNVLTLTRRLNAGLPSGCYINIDRNLFISFFFLLRLNVSMVVNVFSVMQQQHPFFFLGWLISRFPFFPNLFSTLVSGLLFPLFLLSCSFLILQKRQQNKMKVLKKKRRKTGKKSIAQPEPIRTNISI